MRISKTHPFVLPPRRSCPASAIVPSLPDPFHIGFNERRPLLPLSAAKTLLNCDARHIANLMDDGRLRWVFDIRSRDASMRELRILWQSMLTAAGRLQEFYTSEKDEEKEFKQVVELILPRAILMPQEQAGPPVPRELAFRSTELAACLSCQGRHVLRLVREKSLTIVGVCTAPKSPSFVTRASAIKFLKERRIS